MGRIKILPVILFIVFTFVLSWGFDWLIISLGRSEPYSLGMNPWGMLVPAFVALFLQMFVLKNSRIYFRKYREKPRWILLGFMFLTILYGILIIVSVYLPETKQMLQGVVPILFTVWTLSIFFVCSRSHSGAFVRAGLG